VVDLSAVDLILKSCEEAVALGEPVFDCSFIAKARLSRRSVMATKLRGRAMSAGVVMNASVRSLRSHGGMKVGQMIKPPRSPDCGKTRSIKAKEIHTRLAVMFHVSADVEFRKTREARQRRKSAAVNAAHAEWNDSDPAFALVGVESHWLRDERPD